MKGWKLKELREQKKYSQTNFAQKIGMNRTFLSQIESGEAKIPRKYIEKVCDALDITEYQLLTDNLGDIEGKSSKERVERKINKDYLGHAMEIVDSITDASDLTTSDRVELLESTYNMVYDFFENKMSSGDLEEELENLKQKNEKELRKLKQKNERDEKVKQSFFKFLKKNNP